MGLADSPAMPWEYLAVLGACLVATAPLELVLRVGVYRQAKRLLLTLACTGAVFVTWDLVGARLGHWDYDPARVTGVALLGLPLEEYLFFVVVPLCGILGYEAVVASLPGTAAALRRLRGRPSRTAVPGAHGDGADQGPGGGRTRGGRGPGDGVRP